MTADLIRFDLSLPNYFSHPPAPGVATRDMIPRSGGQSLYMRGEFGQKAGGDMRPISSHCTTHLDMPLHFDAEGADLANVLNNPRWPGDRPCLARVVYLAEDPALPGAHTRADGGRRVTYCERVDAALLPGAEELAGYEALVILTGFGAVMSGWDEFQFTPEQDGYYHAPWLADDAVELIRGSGLGLVAIDSTTIERQTSASPFRMTSGAHLSLLTGENPVLIAEGLNGAGIREKAGFVPREAVLHLVPRRVNERGGDAAHCRALLYFYRDDPAGAALRNLLRTITPGEYHG
ncbi:MAG: cyclase family protein [Deltaproteobacteria bacterium]|nr:cyclase family protein [Deltaproteobacteria bacterium]